MYTKSHVLLWISLKKINTLYKDKEFEDTKGVIRIRKSKKNRQHNGQKMEDKRTKIYKTYIIKLKIE
jgi:hypothetical protein